MNRITLLIAMRATGASRSHATIRLGYLDKLDVPESLRLCRKHGLLERNLDLEHASYFVSRITIHPTQASRWRTWGKKLFIAMARNAVVALWLAGAAIAGAIVPLAAARQRPSSGVLYAVVAAALVALAISTARGTRWALRVSVVLLGLQLFGAICSAWQLAHGAADEKAAALKRLGVDPTFGLTLNLIYSAIAFSAFLCAWRQTSR